MSVRRGLPRRLGRVTMLGLVVVLLGACLSPGASTTATPPPSTGTPAPPTDGPPSIGPTPPPTATPTATPAPPPTATPTASLAPTPAPTDAPTATPGWIVHVVVSGDTLAAIARRYATTVLSIAWWNRTAHPTLDPASPAYDPGLIVVGWRLRVLPGSVVDPATIPTPTPTRTPTPTPSAVPSPTAAPSRLVSHGSRTSGMVALTFDMGGRLDPALDIMRWLVDHGVRATVFPTGRAASTTTGRQVMSLVAAHPELFEVGNHSWSHPDFTTLTAGQIADQLTSTEALVADLAGQATKPWFRPPYGRRDDRVLAAVGAAGWRYTVTWDVDTIDWRPISDGGPTAAEIIAKVVASARGGSIVLMHLGGYETLDALPGIVSGLEGAGYELVRMDDLL